MSDWDQLADGELVQDDGRPVSAYERLAFRRLGLSPQEALAWANAGFGHFAAVSWREAGYGPADACELHARGLSSTDIRLAAQWGISLDEMAAWRRHGAMLDEIAGGVRIGITAHQWSALHAAGIALSDAIGLLASGAGVEHVVGWTAAKLSLGVCQRLLDSGVAPDDIPAAVRAEDFGGTSPDSREIHTTRPLGGTMGTALALGTSAERCETLIDALLNNMDQGEGWTWSDSDGRWWLPGRHATRFCFSHDDNYGVCLVDSVVVENVEDHGRAIGLLNQLNAHGAGWFWWLDSDSDRIVASMRYLVLPEAWWWSLFLVELVPLYVTSIDSMGPIVSASCGGTLAVSAHPERGERLSPDGWIIGCRLGSREPTASLGLPILPHELAQLGTALAILCSDPQPPRESPKIESFEPLAIVVHDDDENPTVVLRQVWHPEIGWGAQIATVPGIFAPDSDDLGPLFGLAASLNEHLAKRGDLPGVVAGCWIVTERLGLVHHAYIPGIEVEKAVGEAGETVGNMLALMAQPNERIHDAQELRVVGSRNGFNVHPVPSREDLESLSSLWIDIGPDPVNMSYLADHESDEIDPEEALWMAPKHVPVCSFGIFNPSGPTVSSLEIGYASDEDDNLVMSLYFVLRHPFGPTIEHLGDAGSEGHMAELIVTSMSQVDDGVLGSGPEWMNVFQERYREAVIRGLRLWASAPDLPNREWAEEGALLLRCAMNPWGRMESNEARSEPPPESANDPVGYWIDVLTDWIVIFGEQLYIRSAWEGAIAFLADPEHPGTAQEATNFFLDRIDQRLAASFPTDGGD